MKERCLWLAAVAVVLGVVFEWTGPDVKANTCIGLLIIQIIPNKGKCMHLTDYYPNNIKLIIIQVIKFRKKTNSDR